MGGATIHPDAICLTDDVGEGTQVEAFAVVSAGATVGREAHIGTHARLEPDVVVGDRVAIHSGAQLSKGVRVEADVLVGANATVLPGLSIGGNAVVGAGAVVTRSVPPNAVVVGNPGRIQGYRGSVRADAGRAVPEELSEAMTRESTVQGVTLHRLPLNRDLRGSLVASEFGNDIPFEPKRCFVVFDVPGSEVRGEHAHRTCHQFISCVRGGCSLVVDDGNGREEFRLDHPGLGVHVPPMVWATQFRHTSDAILLVLASHHYDAGDYIRHYEAFLKELRTGRA